MKICYVFFAVFILCFLVTSGFLMYHEYHRCKNQGVVHANLLWCFFFTVCWQIARIVYFT